MGTAIFMVLMVCGYWYSSRDLSSRFKVRRSIGWDVYFLVALYGCIFVLQGMLATAIIWLLLLIVSSSANALHVILGKHLDGVYELEFSWHLGVGGGDAGLRGAVLHVYALQLVRKCVP